MTTTVQRFDFPPTSPTLPSQFREVKPKWLEPAPDRFYCPASLREEWGADFPGEWLGAFILHPGGYEVEVASGPCCRLFYSHVADIPAGSKRRNWHSHPDGGWHRFEPHAFERAYKPSGNPESASARDWVREHPNYLSYLKKSGEYITVRWQSPVRVGEKVQCSLVCPLESTLDSKVA